MITMTLKQFNGLSDAEAIEALTYCCGSSSWVSQVVQKRPFKDFESLLQTSAQIWNGLSEIDWKEAFSHHPKIGDLESLKKKFASTRAWAEQEQRGSAEASVSVIQALALGNETYENRFGYIFIVCATGKTAEEMLSLLEERLKNDPKKEILLAAGEQEKITKLRLEKLIHEST